jgi:hypothetical protein
MLDKPNEIALTMNLLRLPEALPTGDDFNRTFIEENRNKKGNVEYKMINTDEFKRLIKGYVSYFRGANPISFPETKIKNIKCNMSSFQYRAYSTVMGNEKKITSKMDELREMPNSFFIGSRMISNIAFPNNEVNGKGIGSLTYNRILNNLEDYSTKMYAMMSKIKKNGKILIYSNFRGYGGIETMIKVLEAYGYKNYDAHGIGKNRFGVFSGSETANKRDTLKRIYNHENNIYGKNLKIVLISPAAREGISFLNVRQLHILEPYWNMSRIKQIIGRAVRYCSHKQLPPELRNVKIYIYIAVSPNDNKKTIDQYIMNIAINKSKIINEFENSMKEGAIDCKLFKNINYLGNLRCEK